MTRLLFVLTYFRVSSFQIPTATSVAVEMPTTAKRPRTIVSYFASDDKENHALPSDDEAESPAPKRAKSTSTTKATKAKPSPKSKTSASGKKAATKKSDNPSAVYTTTLAAISKTHTALVKRQMPNGGANTDDFAAAMVKFLPSIECLLAFETAESTKLAYIALFHLAEHAHADFAASCKACGYGDAEGPYGAIDEVMVKVLDARLAHDADAAEAAKTAVADLGTGKAAFKPGEKDEYENYYEFQKKVGKWPNKQERGWCDRARKAGWTARAEKRKERREKEGNGDGRWIRNFLEDAGALGEYLEGFGLEEYLKEARMKMQTLIGE